MVTGEEGAPSVPEGDPPFQIPGGAGTGPGMRAMHHTHPQQPPTPPQQQQDPKAAQQAHIQPQPMHMQQGQPQQQQQGPQMMFHSGHVLQQQRPPAPQTMFNRGNAPVSTRPPAPRGIMVNQVPNSYLPANQQQVAYSGPIPQQYMTMPQFVTPNNRFYVPNHQYQGNQYPTNILYMRPTMGGAMMMQPQQAQPGAVAGNVVPQPAEQPVLNPAQRKKPRSNALRIIDPNDGHDVMEEFLKENTPPGSGESSARETPQLADNKVASEFARKVASTLGGDDIRPGSRSSSYSESEPPPELLQNAQRDSIASPKIEPEIIMVPSEMPLVDNSMGFVPPEPPVPLPRWGPPMNVPPPLMMPMAHPEDMLRHPPHREFQGWEPPIQPHQVVVAPPSVPPGVPTSAPPPNLPPPTVVHKKPEQTPVVSALAGPEMDSIHREYPSLGAQRHSVHQSPGRSKRQPRPSQRQEVDVPAPVLVQHPPPVAVIPVVDTPKVPSPVPEPTPVAPVEPAPAVQETPAPFVHPPAVLQPTAPEAKSSHNKNKKRQRQEQQRQATPPPRAVTPVAAPPAPQPAPEPVKQVQQRAASPAPAAPTKASSPAPTQAPVSAPAPQPPVTQVVDVLADKMPNLKINESREVSEEIREERKVAAMNEENDKLTASSKLAAVAIESNGTVDEPVLENNNVPKVTVVVEAAPVTESTPVIENEKPAVKYHYKKEQWSPDNPTGKKQYDRDFIMLLQNDPQSKKKPENLPQLEVLRGGVGGGGGGGNMRGGHPMMHPRMGEIPMPQYMNKSASLRGPGGPRDSNHMKRPSLMGNKNQKNNKPMPIQVSLSLNEDVKLREAETPWKPTRTSGPAELTEDNKTEALYKRVRGILNRLTPQKFGKLLAQIRGLPIDSVERLEGVINLVFEKAIDEPGFSTMYAELCQELGKLIVGQNDDETAKKANFRTLLVQRCQKEFEKDSESEVNREERLKEIEAETNPEKKKEMTATLEEDERKMRVKSVGNVRFIGELYKLRQLTSFIMLNCIDNLIKLNTEESLECLCKLLTTIGRNLDSDILRIKESLREQIKNERENKQRKDDTTLRTLQSQLNSGPELTKYFEELDKIVKGKKTSSRIRFMIQDLIDLRLIGWVPKRDEGPKTMDQIVKDAEREQLETNLALSAAPPMDKGRGPGGRQDSRNMMDNRGGGGRRGGGGQDSNGGWQHVPTSSSTRKQFMEISKLRVTPVEVDMDMGLGNRNAYMWNKGANKSEERKAPPTGFGSTQNKFALLEEREKQMQAPAARTSSLHGTQAQPPEPRDVRPLRPSPSDDGRNVRTTAPLPPAPREAPSDAPAGGPAPMDSEMVERATQRLVDEFNAAKDLEDASKTLEEKFADSVKSELVLNVLLHSLEKSSPFRRDSARMLAHFLQTQGIAPTHFTTGLKEFMGQTEDLVVDIPKLWEYLGELLADVINTSCGLVLVTEALRPVGSGPLRALATMLRVVRADRPDSPGLSAAVGALHAYLGGPQPYKAFITEHHLEFLEAPCPPRSAPPPLSSEAHMTAELTRLLRQAASFDEVTKWVDANVGVKCTEPPFIRVLTNVVLDICITQTRNAWKLESDVLHRHIKLLVRYIDNDAPRELQCIFTIQAKMVALEHPKGVLCDLCQLLQDQGVISSDSFKQWRSNCDPQYMEGRGVCISGLKSFFNMIDEDEDETS